VLAAILILGGLGAFLGLGLALASKKLAFNEDPRLQKIVELMPGANCGACGAAGCFGFAENVLGNAEHWLGKCPVGGKNLAKKTAEILGIQANIDLERKVAQILCGGSHDKIIEKFEYEGIEDCQAAALVAGGSKACAYGCLMFGTCKKVCPFNAVEIGSEGLPVFDHEKCTGCNICVKNCPRNILRLVPYSQKAHVFCNSHDKGATTRKLCKAGCISCGLCVKNCPVETIVIDNNVAVIDYKKCINCRECLRVCPSKCIGELLNKKLETVPAAAY
jgi:RnfABCDGE-type electron transport complex B subunit